MAAIQKNVCADRVCQPGVRGDGGFGVAINKDTVFNFFIVGEQSIAPSLGALKAPHLCGVHIHPQQGGLFHLASARAPCSGFVKRPDTRRPHAKRGVPRITVETGDHSVEVGCTQAPTIEAGVSQRVDH
jgi:hypothetical protein